MAQEQRQGLQSREELYHSIIDHTRDLIVVVAADGTPLYVSPSSQAVLGYSADELMNGRALGLVHEDDRVRAAAAFRDSMSDHETRTVELRCRHQDGRWTDFECVGSWVRSDETLERAVLVFRDVSKRKHAEREMQSLNARLAAREQELMAVLATLQKSHDELQAAQLRLVDAARLESVGRLAAGVAHEVKNPLTVILMGLEYLGKQVPDRDAEVETVLRDMEDAVARANKVVRGLLDFASPGTLDVKLVRVGPLVDKALDLTKHELARAKVKVERDLEPGLAQIQVDRGKIEQVFVNLFLNAAQAMPSGGTLRVRGRNAGDRVAIDIVDSGPGIPEAQLAKVFEPFFTTKPMSKGTGLGLTVIQRIIDMHGAAVRLANEPGGGLRVTLEFRTAGGRT